MTNDLVRRKDGIGRTSPLYVHPNDLSNRVSPIQFDRLTRLVYTVHSELDVYRRLGWRHLPGR